VAIVVVAMAALAFTTLISFALYHALSETVFIAAGVAAFVMAWLLREFTEDDLPVFLAIAFFAAALLHVVQVVDYPGVDMVSTSLESPTQLRVVTTLLLSASFAVAPMVITRRLPVRTVLSAYLIADVIILMAVYWWRIVPAMPAADGDTSFKTAADCASVGLCLLAVLGFSMRRRLLPATAFPVLVAALIAGIGAVIALTVAEDPEAWPGLLGHILMNISTVLVFLAIVQAGIARPHALRISSLVRGERTARADRRQERAIRRALDRLLQLNLSFRAGEDVEQVSLTACESACELFECDHAMLMQIDEAGLELTGIHPPRRDVPLGSRFSIADDPDLMERLRARIPSFKAETSPRTLGPGIAGLAARLNQASVLRAPIGVQTVADGLLVLGWESPRPEPDALMRALLQRFGDQVAAAVAQARQREAQAEAEALHLRFEQSLAPAPSSSHPGLQVYAHYRHLEGRLRLGGDFVDVYDRGHGDVAVVVGDVTGHGPDAAALGAMLRAGWRALMAAGTGPVQIVRSLHRMLRDERTDEAMFATVCLAWIDPGRGEMSIVNVGHPPPLLIDDGGVTRIDVPPLPPLGTFEPVFDGPAMVSLPAGAHLFFYTDGLIEGLARPGSRERFGERRLMEALRAMAGGPIDGERIDRLIRDIEKTGGAAFRDDVTIVVIATSAGDVDEGPAPVGLDRQDDPVPVVPLARASDSLARDVRQTPAPAGRLSPGTPSAAGAAPAADRP